MAFIFFFRWVSSYISGTYIDRKPKKTNEVQNQTQAWISFQCSYTVSSKWKTLWKDKKGYLGIILWQSSMKLLSGLKFSLLWNVLFCTKRGIHSEKSQRLISKFVFIVTWPCPQKSVIHLLQSSTRTVTSWFHRLHVYTTINFEGFWLK